MRARIHFTHRDGTDDSFWVGGEDIAELRTAAEEWFEDRRIPDDVRDTAWSEIRE